VVAANEAGCLAAILGAAATGAGVILLPPSWPAAKLMECGRAAGIPLLVSGPAHRDALAALGAREIGLGGFDLAVFRVDPPGSAALRVGDFVGQFTSGVDAPSKIAVRTHAAIWNEVEDFSDAIALTDRDVVAVLPPISHSYGLMGGTLAPLCRGARVILSPRFDPAATVTLLRRERPTILYAVPVMYQALLAANLCEARDFASVRLCFSAGAPLPVCVEDAFAARFGRHVCQNYGTTEAGVICLQPDRTPERQGWVGPPIRNRTVTIVDEQFRPLGAGVTGRVVVHSPAVARTYLAAPGAAGGPIDSTRFVTGDLGRVDAAGNLLLVGRTSQLVRIGDTLLHTGMIEAAVGRMPGVHEVAAVSVPDSRGAERLRVVVVGDRGTAGDVLRRCRECLDDHVVLVVVVRSSLPRTPAGKILRRSLREERDPATPADG